MEARNCGAFFDDFVGGALISEVYTPVVHNGIAELYVPTVAGHSYDDDESSGAIIAAGTNHIGGYGKIYFNGPLQFSRANCAVFRSRFRLIATASTEVQLGFWRDTNNRIVLDYDASVSAKWRFQSRNGGTITTTAHADDADAGWHKVEIRLLGSRGSAELVLDEDESKKVVIVNGNLSSEQLGMYVRGNSEAALGAGDYRGALVDWWAANNQRFG